MYRYFLLVELIESILFIYTIEIILVLVTFVSKKKCMNATDILSYTLGSLTLIPLIRLIFRLKILPGKLTTLLILQ